MRVENFAYDGLFVHPLEGYALYTAEFKEWTEDPGIAVCICSDGVERMIPSCCLEGFDDLDLPEQKCEAINLFGIPCKS